MNSKDIKAYVQALFGLAIVVALLYLFLVALDLMGKSLQVLVGDNAANLFTSIDNPLAGLTIGTLVTVMVQSSSTTTSIIVALVGAGTLTVDQAVYIVFGANIGTSVTNSLVCLGFMNDRENYRRGFAAATVHDMFNLLNVAVWFPLEWITDAINNYNGGALTLLTKEMVKGFEECDPSDSSCEAWTNPIKTWTDAIVKKMIVVNSNVIKDFAFGEPSQDLCGTLLCDGNLSCSPHSFFDKRCSSSPLAEPGTVCDGTNEKVRAKFLYCLGPLAANQTILDAAKAHYEAAELNSGGYLYPKQMEAGAINLVIALIMIFACLILMVKLLGWLIRGRAERLLKRSLNMNGYLAILIGTGVTMLVQSSSITTATLTPLAALGTITLESMLPLTIGANLGTTFTGVLASMVGDNVDGFQIALVHVMFNVFGAVMFYPIPALRRIPLRAARKLGDIAYVSKPFPPLYIFGSFLVAPAILLGLSLSFSIGGTVGLVCGIIATIVLFFSTVYFVYWYRRKGGKERLEKWMQDKHARNNGIDDATAVVDINDDSKLDDATAVVDINDDSKLDKLDNI